MYPRNNKCRLNEEIVLGNAENVDKRSCIASPDTTAIYYGASKVATAQAIFHGSGIQHSGQGDFVVQGNINVTSNPLPKDKEAEKERKEEERITAECKKVLFVIDPTEDRDMLKRKKGSRATGTCEWIFNTTELTSWLRPDEGNPGSRPQSVLWLHGNPGMGKSTMAIYFTEELSKQFEPDKPGETVDKRTLAYFFCDTNFEKRKTATSIVKGLLYQLVQVHDNLLSRYILPKYKERKDQMFTSIDALWALFIAAAADQDTGRKYCIIDALDECDSDSQEVLLYHLQETFHYQDKAPSNVRFLITSRPYPEIRECLQVFTNKDLATFYQMRQDIDRCIYERVNDLSKKKQYTDKVKREISIILREKAEGTFLWIVLACEELKRKPSKDAIHFLQTMPKGLTSLYEKLLQTAVEDEYSDNTVRRILGFITVSFEALSVLELADACQLHQDEPDVQTRIQYTRDQIASCRLLVIIQDEKVQLLHQSVRDFLVGPGSNSFVDRLNAHVSAASRCINFLVEATRGSFFRYASAYWPQHAREAQERFEICRSQIQFFEANSPSMKSWLVHHPGTSGFSLLHVAARWELPTLMEYALGLRNVYLMNGESIFIGKLDVNRLDLQHRLPLALALEWGAGSGGIEIVDMLLQAGVIVRKEDVKKAIQRYHKHPEVVLLLLERLEDRKAFTQSIMMDLVHQVRIQLLSAILSKYGHQVLITGDIIIAAIRNERQGKSIMELFLRHQSNQAIITKGVIFEAVMNHHRSKDIIYLISQKTRNPVAIMEDAMVTAAMYFSVIRELIEFLIQGGGSVTITKKILETVLYDGFLGYKHQAAFVGLVFQNQGTLDFTSEAFAAIIEFRQSHISESTVVEDDERNSEEASEIDNLLLEDS
ncbi:uncharacterized protein Triagg1_7450 [Trichoderma aggressivum f. europaeum]|uniref:Nephrocystin 3-like N-terminal domain-containing protein n=1 Tax=Trichoderma aggressivum f. europaeum TaxID=173218 RepID=A0AAE1I9L0_9HYPO|nr:hypothetical protein Triagg1_7450 [Trichoderma aggressivum f. europaeum]